MKQYLQKMKLFLYICLGFIILNACTFEEEIIKQNGYQEKMKLESKKFSELLQLPAFSNAYKRVINKKVTLSNDLAARTALEDQYGFTIVENKDVKIITDIDGSIYYSMLIERAIKENLKFENLVIKVVDEEVAAYILKHELNEKALFDSNNESYSYNLKETKIEALNNENITSSRVRVIRVWQPDCIVSFGSFGYCGGNPNHPSFTANCGHFYDVLVYSNDPLPGDGSSVPIPTGGEGGGPGGGNYSNGSSNNGTNQNGETPLTDNTPPIKNVIIVPDEEVEVPKTPCTILKSTFESSLNVSNFNVMNNTANNPNFKGEAGMIFTVGTNGSYSSSSITSGNTNTSVGYAINVPYGTMTNGSIVYAAAHTHPITDDGSPIFSLADLFVLAKLYKSVPPHLRSEVFFILSIPNGATYAITVNNFNSLMQFINSFGLDEPSIARINDQENKWMEKNAVFDKKCKPTVPSTDTNYINKTVNKFLNLIKDKGVDLYEKDSGGWNKLVLPQSGSENLWSDKIPCSNH